MKIRSAIRGKRIEVHILGIGDDLKCEMKLFRVKMSVVEKLVDVFIGLRGLRSVSSNEQCH